jgi:hypothetical protein
MLSVAILFVMLYVLTPDERLASVTLEKSLKTFAPAQSRVQHQVRSSEVLVQSPQSRLCPGKVPGRTRPLHGE